MDEYAEAIVTAAVKWYKGETDHTGLADAIQEYLISQKKVELIFTECDNPECFCHNYLARRKHDEYFGSQKKKVEEIKPIAFLPMFSSSEMREIVPMTQNILDIIRKLNEIIRAVNKLNEK